MTPTIRVDDEVMALLKENVQEPFLDTPNTVLRRLLGLESGRARRSGWQSGKRAVGRTPQQEYRLPILRALVDLGGKARVDHVLNKVHTAVKSRLKPIDLETVSSGTARWRNAAQWERFVMIQEGLLKPSARKGDWEITETGRRYLERARSEQR